MFAVCDLPGSPTACLFPTTAWWRGEPRRTRSRSSPVCCWPLASPSLWSGFHYEPGPTRKRSAQTGAGCRGRRRRFDRRRCLRLDHPVGRRRGDRWLAGRVRCERGQAGVDVGVERTEALASWVENVRDVLQSGNQPVGAIGATTETCPPSIRPIVRVLFARLAAGQPAELAFRGSPTTWTSRLPTSSPSVCSSPSHAAPRPRTCFRRLPTQARHQADRRRIVEAERAPMRREVWMVSLVMCALLGCVFLFARSSYLNAYDNVPGQVFLALVLVGYGALLMWVGRLATFPQPIALPHASAGRFMTAAARLIVATLVGSGGVWLLLAASPSAVHRWRRSRCYLARPPHRAGRGTDRRLGAFRPFSGSPAATSSRGHRRPSPDASTAGSSFGLSRLRRGGGPVRTVAAAGDRAGAWDCCRSDCCCRSRSRSSARSSVRSSCTTRCARPRPSSATTCATSSPRTSMWSRCCSPATSATRVHCARRRRRATVGSSSSCAGGSSLPRRRTARWSLRSRNSATTSISSSCNRSPRRRRSAASAGAPGRQEPRRQVRNVARRAVVGAGDRRPGAHRKDHRAARRHVAADHGGRHLPSPQLLSIGAPMNIELMLSALTHVIYGQLRRFTIDRRRIDDTRCRLAGAGAVVRCRRRRGRGDRRRSCGARSRPRPRSRSRRRPRREARS